MQPFKGNKTSEKSMFESLGNAIRQEQAKLAKKQQWVRQFVKTVENKAFLINPFRDVTLIHKIPSTISKLTQIAGIDGGLISEAMTGFDLALYRAVAAVFRGIGEKVESTYIPHLDPDPQIFFSPSLKSRHEFNRLGTLLRLYSEYEVAKMTIEKETPTVIFIDGKVTPLHSDFSIQDPSKLIQQAEQDVKQIYRELVDLAFDKQVLLCGVVKDSRSRELTKSLGKVLPKVIENENLDPAFMQTWPYILDDMQDSFLAESILKQGERTAWVKSELPTWLEPNLDAELWMCQVKPVKEDQPIRFEIIIGPQEESLQNAANIALGGLQILCNHGLPIALPTVILEADERTKLNSGHLDAVIDQISMTLGVPREQLRKRRFFSSSLGRL